MFSKLIAILTLTIALIFGVSDISSATPACSFGHCTQFDALTVKICKQKYGENTDLSGKTLELYENGNPCLCPCSCSVPETLISLADDEETMIRTLRKHDFASVPLAPNRFAEVDGAVGSKVENYTLQELLFSNDELLRVSPNHTFVRPEGMIVTALALKPNDQVLDGKGSVISVIQSRSLKNYTGALFNFIVSPNSSTPSDHIIVNNGVQSGDWLLQSTQDLLKDELNLRTGNVITAEEISNL